MRTFLLLGLALLGFAPQQGTAPINAMCPVKPKLKAKAGYVVLYEGQVIGFC